MLTHLAIKQFTLVENLELDIAQGFTVITGETGAGKSILLDALGLCLGDKADGQAVRHGADKAELSALFDVSQLPQAQAWLTERDLAEDECCLRRVVYKEGRSKAWVNGSVVTLAELRSLGELLINIHSQHAHQSLLKKETHRQLLDNVGHLQALVATVGTDYQQWLNSKQQLANSQANYAAQQARLELLNNYVDELEKLALKTGEYEQLEQEYDYLANYESLMQDSQQALSLLDEGEHPVSRQLQQALRVIETHQTRSHSLANVCTSLQSALIEIKESSRELNGFLAQQDLDPQRLAWLEDKISEAQRLARKHKIMAHELPTLHQEFSVEQQHYQQAQDLSALEQAVEQAKLSYLNSAEQLRQARQAVAPQITEKVTQHLRDLSMPNTQLSYQFKPLDKPNRDGLDDIELLFSANLGQQLQPLAKIASGGELSRFALAVQVIQAQHSAVPVLVFDEVDVGISGGTAEVVGNLLRQLGERAQILCITHQPQVAAKGHSHWQVQKYTQDQKTLSRVIELTRQQRIEEIARMSGGLTITQETLKHAESMLSNISD
ncbi:DNA repair protein RecN [uncultured Agitococcus sp.]|uniref:DNA repair protein RecN n=1 Tax=uncultured Agitococcus sp. TaxID=1506599 RepID=UPI00263142F4|nr:DNA repair protein RecN [uncultured Agitococcus sp.]